MVAKLKNQGEITIISIKGTLDIEQTQPFREVCLKHFQSKKLVFNMENANFVGSTGLQPFMETVKELTKDNTHGLKMVGLKSEFKRLFLSLQNDKIHLHETEHAAIASFDQPQIVETIIEQRLPNLEDDSDDSKGDN